MPSVSGRVTRLEKGPNLGKNVEKWTEQPLLLRLDMCATMLFINDCISASDRKKIHQKIMKLKEQLNATKTGQTESGVKIRIVE